MLEPELLDRINNHARRWGVASDDAFETETSAIAFGSRDGRAVVLKVLKRPGDEWLSGETLEAFAGNGVVRVHEHVPGAVLMERVNPGKSVVEISLNGNDEEATDIIAGVIERMTTRTSSIPDVELPNCPTVLDWAQGFARYIESGDECIPMTLVEAGQQIFLSLYASQQRVRLLHGDLQHYNILFDSDRGWVAIDPKGVIGELEFEIGAVLRNPIERSELFLSPATIERRLKQFSNNLNLDSERMLAWGFAQAVLSAIWAIEDGFPVHATNSALRLAEDIRPMLR